MGNFGVLELLIIFGGLIFVFIIPIVFIYKYGKLKGRVKELERQLLEQRNVKVKGI